MDPGAYTLTGAADWKMFVFMCGVIGAFLAILCAIVGFMWRDLKNRFSESVKQRTEICGHCKQERTDNCKSCHNGIFREFDAVWKAMDQVAPRAERREDISGEAGA